MKVPSSAAGLVVSSLPQSGISQALLASPSSSQSSNDPSALTTRSNRFSNDLEKFISDYKKGRAEQRSPVLRELSLRSQKASAELSKSDPSSLLLLQSYTSGLSFEYKARFVRGVGEGVERMSVVQDAAQRLKSLA